MTNGQKSNGINMGYQLVTFILSAVFFIISSYSAWKKQDYEWLTVYLVFLVVSVVNIVGLVRSK